MNVFFTTFNQNFIHASILCQCIKHDILNMLHETLKNARAYILYTEVKVLALLSHDSLMSA